MKPSMHLINDVPGDVYHRHASYHTPLKINLKCMKKLTALLFLVSLLISADLAACTSAIITGKITPDGRPLLWKHRDTGEENNRIEYFKGEKYNFLALVNSPGNLKDAWTGTNNAGFSIMNTASYNLKNDNVDPKLMDKEGELMFKALSVCKNLADFEKFLDKYKRPIGVEANFGVIDAEGGAAYYEVNNSGWTKIDVNDPKIAPQGFLVYTNFSYTGRYDEGMGYIRYTTACQIMNNYAGQAGKFTPEWIFKNLSRSFYNSLLDIDLVKDNDLLKRGSGWFVEQDFIPRKSSTASIVIQGVKKGENPANIVMWSLIGYPPAGVAVPMFVAAGENQPAFMLKSGESENASMCDWSLKQKHAAFPVTRGNGAKYFNFNLLYNDRGTGYMQLANQFESEIFKMAVPVIEEFRATGFDAGKLKGVYDFVEKNIK